MAYTLNKTEKKKSYASVLANKNNTLKKNSTPLKNSNDIKKTVDEKVKTVTSNTNFGNPSQAGIPYNKQISQEPKKTFDLQTLKAMQNNPKEAQNIAIQNILLDNKQVQDYYDNLNRNQNAFKEKIKIDTTTNANTGVGTINPSINTVSINNYNPSDTYGLGKTTNILQEEKFRNKKAEAKKILDENYNNLSNKGNNESSWNIVPKANADNKTEKEILDKQKEEAIRNINIYINQTEKSKNPDKLKEAEVILEAIEEGVDLIELNNVLVKNGYDYRGDEKLQKSYSYNQEKIQKNINAFMSDKNAPQKLKDDLQEMIDLGYDEKELNDKLKKMGYNYDKLGDFKDRARDVAGGTIGQIPAVAGNVGNFIGDATGFVTDNTIGLAINPFLDDGTKAGDVFRILGDVAQQKGENARDSIENTITTDPLSNATKTGEFLTEVGTTFVPVAGVAGKTAIGAKALKNIDKVTDANKYLKAGKELYKNNKYVNNAVEGAVDMAKYDVVSKGEINPVDVAGGAIAGGAITGVGNLSNKILKKATESDLKNLVGNSSLKYAKSLIKDDGLKIDNLGAWIARQDVNGNKIRMNNKKNFLEDIDNLYNDSKKVKEGIIRDIDSKGKIDISESNKESIKEFLKDYVKDNKFKSEEFKPLIEEAKRIYKKKGDYTLADVEFVRDKIPYTTADNKAFKNNLKTVIEKNAEKYGYKDMAELNNQIQITYALKKGITKEKTVGDYAIDLLESNWKGGLLGGIGSFINDGTITSSDGLTVLLGGIGMRVGQRMSRKFYQTFTKSEQNIINKYLKGDKDVKITDGIKKKIRNEYEKIYDKLGEKDYKKILLPSGKKLIEGDEDN